MPGALKLIEEALTQKSADTAFKSRKYEVPSLWIRPGYPRKLAVDPAALYLDIIKTIRSAGPPEPRKGPPTNGEWSRHAVVYNMFVRATAAFDHNGNGKLDLPLNSDGFRETGTFLKAIAMLPYVKRLGANTIHLLPITSIGHDGNKGTLGSPYAIRNPYELDDNLAEPFLGLDVKSEFKAFVEAAHRLGLRVVVEFVFRTAAKDGDWIREHPEWFYWIREDVLQREPHENVEHKYGSPVFSRSELDQIHRAVNDHRLDQLIPPHQIYRDFFVTPPQPAMVSRVNGRYLAQLPDGRKARIPGAFADWPPDDNQPPWGDVTYLRMYDHPDFNYIAYDTIRMYDARLARPEHANRPLWDKIIGIIPYYQREFHIDGVMIDMGHALPGALKEEMVRTARDVDPDFAFWDENFSVTARSREEGYNAVVGYCWIDQHHPDRMRKLCLKFASEGFPIPFFATPENHNTPRAADRPGGVVYARWAYCINAFLPAILFIHSGYELAERYPINTGLDFTPEQLKNLPSEKLPLFSEYMFDWMNPGEFTEWIARISAIRKQYEAVIVDSNPHTFRMLHVSNDRVLAFARVARDHSKRIAVIGNMNYAGAESVSLHIDSPLTKLVDLLSGTEVSAAGGRVDLHLSAGQCLVFEY